VEEGKRGVGQREGGEREGEIYITSPAVREGEREGEREKGEEATLYK
jgi:hypothetical protein